MDAKAESAPLVPVPSKVTIRQHLLLAQIVLAMLVDSTYVNEVCRFALRLEVVTMVQSDVTIRFSPQIFAFLPDWVEARGLNSVWVGIFVAVQSFGVVVSAAFGAKFVRKIGNAIALLLSVGLIVSAANRSPLHPPPSPRAQPHVARHHLLCRAQTYTSPGPPQGWTPTFPLSSHTHRRRPWC